MDRIELVIYSAAEHCDDLDTICRTLFPTDTLCAKNANVRRLKEAMRPIRKTIASYANYMKHSHNRVRIFESELIFATRSVVFPGFFLESSDGNAIRPNPLFHGNGLPVVSLSTLIWTIFHFLIESSSVLAMAATAIIEIAEKPTEVGTTILDKLISQIMELPAYHFGECHLLQNCRLQFHVDESLEFEPIRGSIALPWPELETVGSQIGYWAYRYSGDGVTRAFSISLPRNLSLIRLN
ncbi:hypothetical protein [Rhizobium sp. Rhizsp82]|uniref:hypothetical protein n=1 Tax=Rhizobium sp. Rhizsp82 TaxID=3243057 RepID=UPI0039B44AFA